MDKPSVEWIKSLVQKRREAGGYSEEELQAYEEELMRKWGFA